LKNIESLITTNTQVS